MTLIRPTRRSIGEDWSTSVDFNDSSIASTETQLFETITSTCSIGSSNIASGHAAFPQLFFPPTFSSMDSIRLGCTDR